MVERKIVDSRNMLIYFMKVISEGVSQGVVRENLVPSMLLQSFSSIKALDVVIYNFGSNMAFNQSCKSHKGSEIRYFFVDFGEVFKFVRNTTY